MNDDQLRGLVREAVERHLRRARPPHGGAGTSPGPEGPARQQPNGHPWQQHASHHLYLSLVNVDGSCVIEPSVACDHCGFCKSHGH